MMSMASVTMKALRRRRTTMKPLMKPMRPPTSSTTRMPTKVGSSKPKPKLAAGTTTMAPIAGANPYTDSSDRSNLPVMMTSDSASTTRASAADEVRMVLILPEVRKTGLTIVPIMTSRASAGSSARSRRRATTILVAVGAIRAPAAIGIGLLLFATLISPRSKPRERCRSIPPRVPRRPRRAA